MPLTLPYQITAGQKLLSKPVRDNFQAIADKFTGGIVDGDCSTTMNLQGSKLLDLSVPGTKLADLAVSSGKIALLAVGTAQLADSTGADGVTTAKLATASVSSAKLKVTIHTVAFSLNMGAVSILSQAANPSATFPKATYDLYDIYVKNVSTGAGLLFAAGGIADDSGANWAGKAWGYQSISGGSFTGTLVYVFLSKA